MGCDCFENDEAVTSFQPAKGDVVRVNFEATYVGTPNPVGKGTPDKHMIMVDGRETWIPNTADLTVIRKAVPVEPPPGTVVDFPDGARWVHFPSLVASYWYRVDRVLLVNPRLTWESVLGRHGTSYAFTTCAN